MPVLDLNLLVIFLNVMNGLFVVKFLNPGWPNLGTNTFDKPGLTGKI